MESPAFVLPTSDLSSLDFSLITKSPLNIYITYILRLSPLFQGIENDLLKCKFINKLPHLSEL